jgi:simple sugar transport system permease protein
MDLLAFFDIAVLDGTVRLGVPLLLACLAGLFSERAGIFDIGLEGKMLIAAFLAAGVSFTTGSVWLGLIAGVMASVVLSLLHGLASITFRGNQLISGVAINFFASGITVVAAQAWFGEGGRTPSLSGAARFESIQFPGALTRIRDIAKADLPMKVYSELALGSHDHCLPLHPDRSLRLVDPLPHPFRPAPSCCWRKSRRVDTAGISVYRMRYSAVIICGVLCGLAGAYLSTGLQAGFVREMTAGRGYIALAALIFAKWRPWQALGATMLFGYLQALAIRPDILERAIGIRVQTQVLDALPYVLTVIVLAGFVGKAIPPRAGGEAYVKER